MKQKRFKPTKTEKRCSKCERWQLLENFRFVHSKTNRLISRCKSCEKEDRFLKALDPQHKLKQRDAYLKTTYKLSLDEYNNMLESQNYVCAVCKQPEKSKHQNGQIKNLAVDHDHSCCPGSKSCGGCIRGLLCVDCNQTLGSFDDKIIDIQSAIDYLKEFCND